MPSVEARGGWEAFCIAHPSVHGEGGRERLRQGQLRGLGAGRRALRGRAEGAVAGRDEGASVQATQRCPRGHQSC